MWVKVRSTSFTQAGTITLLSSNGLLLSGNRSGPTYEAAPLADKVDPRGQARRLLARAELGVEASPPIPADMEFVVDDRDFGLALGGKLMDISAQLQTQLGADLDHAGHPRSRLNCRVRVGR